MEVPDGGFKVVLIDSPWRYKNWSDTAHGSHKPHYEGLTYEQLAPIPVDEWAAKDAILLQWGTWPKLDQALDLIRDWNFDYVTGFPWVKTTADLTKIRRGVGFWSMGCTEFVLIGRRGKPKVNKVKPNVLGLLCGSERSFWGPRPRGGDHSNKPYTLHEWAEEKVDGPYLELFAREPREGWTCWGHELGQHVYGEGVITVAEAVALGLIPDGASGVPESHRESDADAWLEGF